MLRKRPQGLKWGMEGFKRELVNTLQRCTLCFDTSLKSCFQSYLSIYLTEDNNFFSAWFNNIKQLGHIIESWQEIWQKCCIWDFMTRYQPLYSIYSVLLYTWQIFSTFRLHKKMMIWLDLNYQLYVNRNNRDHDKKFKINLAVACVETSREEGREGGRWCWMSSQIFHSGATSINCAT